MNDGSIRPDATTPNASESAASESAGINWQRFAITVVLCIPIIALFYFGLHTDPRDIASRLPGTPAPDFKLATIDGSGPVSLSALHGNYVVINFWASWCEPCRVEHAELVATANEYTPRGIHFVGILDGDDAAGAQRYFSQMGPFPYATLLPDTSHTGIQYGLNGVPETFIVDRAGVIRYTLKGAWGVPLHDGEPAPHLGNVLDSLMAVDKAVSER